MRKYVKGFLIKFISSTIIYLGLLYILLTDKSLKIFNLTLVYITIISFLIYFLIYSIRKDLIKNTNTVCKFIDNVICKRTSAEFNFEEETLFSKEQSKVRELVHILDSEKKLYEEEKKSIQSLVSDLSHQIKTPLSNLSIYNSTLLDREIDRSIQIEFLESMKGQIEKLNWLVDALVKISRLETELITLKKGNYKIEDTLALAIGSVYSKCKEKNIDINITDIDGIEVYHDKKWTAEALFNIIENAVKYSNINSEIDISVKELEVFIRIDIKDCGLGIKKEDLNDIFKRFYRSEEVREYSGVGIGLYLAREIILRQGGYIIVNSTIGEGSVFSVFLLKTY